MIDEIIDDARNGIDVGVISAKFHNALVEIIVAVARHAGQTRVVLTGGCFQNRYLTERSVQRLLEEGFRPYWHQRVPTNDGGIALGGRSSMRRGACRARRKSRGVSAKSRREIFCVNFLHGNIVEVFPKSERTIINEVTADHAGFVLMKTRIGRAP